MKYFNYYLSGMVMIFISVSTYAQQQNAVRRTPLMINAWRPLLPPAGYQPHFKDIDLDGDPDILYSQTVNGIPLIWIDDDDDMKYSDIDGDTDNDCLLIDRNKDGKYGGMGDLIVDWIDNDHNGKADMQLVVEYPETKLPNPWPNGHYMWVLDTDGDQVFNYIDWNTLQIKAWDKSGLSDFFPDYSGKSAFMKIHVATYTMDNLKLNWENPFLFFDPDHDGYTEMAVRMVDSPEMSKKAGGYQVKESGNIDWVSLAVDMDDDNGPGNEFDYDLSINFQGGGFDYTDQVHHFHNQILSQSDTFFLDARWRHLNELIYPDHEHALDLTFNSGKWKKTYFVFDEDDDCNRWERVEFLDPLDPFKVGTGKGGLDNNVQADIAGDRGEWDMDNSGKGQLYVGKFDGRIHLYGAEWGAWRIDQNATLYQGWDRKFLNQTINRFATVKYEDKDKDGFLDKVLYDLDGDHQFEDSVDLHQLAIDDKNTVINISNYTYRDYTRLMKKVSDNMWKNAAQALNVAHFYHLNTFWYSRYLHPGSMQQKYSDGYWLQYYLYRDLRDLFVREKDKNKLIKLKKAYYGGDWSQLKF